MKSVRWAFNFGTWKPTEEQWNRAAGCIQRDEFDRIQRFVFKKDAKASMVGRLLMRKLAVEELGLDSDVVEFDRTEHGKPYMVNVVSSSVAPALSFNVSHQGCFCVLAAEPNRPVGVDIMKIEYSGGKPVPEFFRLMKRQCTASEWATILESPIEREQLCSFYRHWCLKESYVKALGSGIGFDLQRVAFRLNSRQLVQGKVTADASLDVDRSPATNWTFEETLLDADHCVAVALGPRAGCSSEQNVATCSASRPDFKILRFEDVVRNLVPAHKLDPSPWSEFDAKLEKPS